MRSFSSLALRTGISSLAFRVGVGLAALLLAGCDTRPKAPALRDSPVFHSKQEGFRFLVPEGWTKSAHGVLPSGKLKGEVLFAQFRVPTSEQEAMLDVLCFSEGTHASPQSYHAGPSHGASEWTETAPPEPVEINRTPAERLVYSAMIGKQPMTKEVIAFRRNERVYSFIGLFAASDNAAQQELRRATNSIVWEN